MLFAYFEKYWRDDMRRRVGYIVISFTIMCLMGCVSKKKEEFCFKQTELVCEVYELHNGDAKFWKDKVITSIDGKLALLSLNGNIEKQYDINASWIDGDERNNILVYGNSNNEIGIVIFDNNNDVVLNKVILKSNNLQIDPTISVIEGDYYITTTEIKGNVNNASVDQENGEYILHLYESDNLENWNKVSDIVDEYNNIEDVDIILSNDELIVVYEKEELDKGKSSIMMKRSNDRGRTWEGEKELLEADSDHEPATLFKFGEGYILYYSSDYNGLIN